MLITNYNCIMHTLYCYNYMYIKTIQDCFLLSFLTSGSIFWSVIKDSVLTSFIRGPLSAYISSICCSQVWTKKTGKTIYIKDVRPSDKFDNPYLIIPWVTNDNSEHLCEPVSGTCFRVICTLLYLHEHCPYITYYCFCCQSFIIILQKC